MDPVVPDYGGRCITGLAPALVGAQPVDWLPAPVAGADAVVLLVVDGLGWDAIGSHRSEMPELAGLDGGPITTVVPSTTASALTSLATGLAPSQHGLVGFRMRVDGTVLNVLSWHTDRGRGPDPFLVQRHDAFLGRAVPAVTKREFRNSGFTDAQLRGTRFVGWSAVSSLIVHCRELIAAGERLVHAYYPSVDNVAHEYGVHSDFFRAELRAADALVGAMLDSLPASTALLVTSDHGQVQIEPEGWIALPELDPLLDFQAGDARFRYLYARRGAAAELTAAAHDEAGGRAWVLTREQLLDEGWLGPRPTGSIGGRVGDVVMAARDPVAFVDPALPREAGLLAMHGSLTAAEMQVPLLAGRGRG
ncbi:MAG: alkaline phosphatase family protein [Acidimicrobiia bacterium]